MRVAHCIPVLALLLAHVQALALSATKLTYAAEVLFGPQGVVVDGAGRARLLDLVERAEHGDVEAVIAVGHADAGEADAQALSRQRAKAVRWHLIQLGTPPRRIYTEGQGSTRPVSPDAARNRRVEVEWVGVRSRTDFPGVQWMHAWQQDLEAPASSPYVIRDEWTDLGPLDVLPRVEPELRARFVQRLKLSLSARQDEAGLRRLREWEARVRGGASQ